jgi:hypothetical protein
MCSPLTKEEKVYMEKELTKDGWYTLWHDENWVSPDATNPDWEGMSITQAYMVMMNKRCSINDT